MNTRILLLLLMTCLSFQLIGQEKIEKKKVKIITETVDENGERTREVLEAEDEEADRLLEEHKELLEEQNIEIELLKEKIDDQDIIMKKIEIDSDDFEWDGDDEDVEVIVKRLKGKGKNKWSNKRNYNDFPRNYSRENRFFMESDYFENNNKASLGVIVEDTEDGVIIEDFVDGSAAQKAGLRRGDIILKINKRYIFSDTGLVKALSPYDPGEKVKVKFLRNGDEKSEKVKLNKRN